MADIPFGYFERIYPTENDIAFASYNGINGNEVNYSNNLHQRNPKNCILANLDGFGVPQTTAGFEVSGTGGLGISVTGGRAYIQGRFIETNTGVTVAETLIASNDNFIYLQLNISGTVNVSPPARIVVVSGAIGAVHSPPANSTLLAKITTDATTITILTDMRSSQINIPVYLDALTAVSDISTIFGFSPYRALSVPMSGNCVFGGIFGVILTGGGGTPDVEIGIEVIGPNGTLSNTVTFTPNATSVNGLPTDYKAIYCPIDNSIGRYYGNILYFRTKCRRLSGSLTITMTTEVSGKDHNSINIRNCYAFKEWGAPN